MKYKTLIITATILLSVMITYATPNEAGLNTAENSNHSFARSISKHHDSIQITHSSNQREYFINGAHYKWSDLSESQQERILEIEQTMETAERKFELAHRKIEPMLKQIEAKLEPIKEFAEKIEINRDTMTLRELEEMVHNHSKQLELQEMTLLENEDVFREYETKIHEEAKAFEMKVDSSINAIIDILENG
ncbi:MAG: hypothetical protein HWE27_06040 [Gammaproteobacteria bacterium]|nr:hypothetical protein [Gammaproteobacteria bacterium]